MASVDGSRSIQISSDQACSNECDPCKYTDIHKEATHYCNDCQEYLCGTCTDSHKGLKLLRNHTLIAVSDLSKQPLSSPDVSCTVLCGCDQNARITDYCESHNAVICHTCKTIKHRKCKTGSINASSASEETLGAVTENANKIQEEIAESIKVRNKDLDNLTLMKESCTNDVESFAEQLKEFVESLKQDALNDVNDREREQRREIEHQITSLSTTKDMLEKDQNVLQVAIKSGNKSDIFAADIKISKRLEDYRTLLHDISVETKSTEMEFEKNEQLVDIEVAISTLGTLKILEDKKLKGKTFPELTAQSCNKIDIKLTEDTSVPYVTGCVIMPDGDIIICDRSNQKIKHFSSTFNSIGSLQLQTRTWDASMIDETSILVCLPDKKQLQYIEVKPRLKTGLVLQLDASCYGIDVVEHEIYISCHPGKSIQVLDGEGKLKRKININADTLTDKFSYLKVKPRLDKLYVTDNGHDKLVCLKSDGNVVFEYRDKELNTPRGFCIDDEGNALLCGFFSHNVHIVNASGKRVGTLLSANDGLQKPHKIAFNDDSGTLIVGCNAGNFLLVYKLA